jgi:hypothetical protein
MYHPPASTRSARGARARTGRAALTLLVSAALVVGGAAGARAMRGGAEYTPAAGSEALRAAPPADVPSWDSVDAEPLGQRGGAAAGSPRPFEHERHEAVSCTVCHGAGERHRTLLVRTPRECAACHHDLTRAVTCTGCHATGTLPEPGTLLHELSLSISADTRTRALPFGHVLHAAVPCHECHRAPVTLAMDRSCGSCHEAHHRAEAECTACHSPPQLPVHGAEVHLSCAGAGCHAPDVAPPPTLSRSLCTACHTAQRTHEPDGVCASCHLIRPAP